MISFSYPAMLWALSALAIPWAIHLLSRKEGKVIRIGSIRHIQETSTRQFKGIRLNEMLLLALRSLIVIMSVLVLAGLKWSRPGYQDWVLAEPGLEHNPMIKHALDSLQKQGYQLHSLTSGFPTETTGDTTQIISYADLLHDLQAQPLRNAIVFAYNKVISSPGSAQVLPPHVRWIGVPAPASEFIVMQVQHTPDTVATRIGYSSADQTRFISKLQQGVAQKADIPPIISVALLYDDNYQYDATIIRAALATLEQSLPVTFVVKDRASTNETFTWCIALGTPDGIPKTAGILRMAEKTHQPLLQQTGPHEWELTKRLNPETAIHENLIIQLAGLMVPTQRLQIIAQQNDRRMMPDQMLWSPARDADLIQNIEESATLYLWLVLIALLIAERMVAYQRNQ
ncbi:MAG TPA: BatA domain-containing protein [Cyclobacteriaceae bacterium]|nr:BatA domain-containing protein [Cyclobacteriaceae bacterium]